jgi:hypothetical protein
MVFSFVVVWPPFCLFVFCGPGRTSSAVEDKTKQWACHGIVKKINILKFNAKPFFILWGEWIVVKGGGY